MSDLEHDLRLIFRRLRERAPLLARGTAAERRAKIKCLYQSAYDMRDEIGVAGLLEVGQDGRSHLIPLKDKLAVILDNLEGWMKRAEVDPAAGRRGYVQYEPKGVVLHLSVWNSPILSSFSPVASMIAAGNAVLLKPSEVSPYSADVIEKIVERAGLTDDVAVVKGGAEVAQALLTLPFNHICYIGSNRIGRLVMEAAAKHFAGVTLEMGGKNPIIVAADADLDDAAAKIVAGRMGLAGQACLCPDYLLADQTIKEDLSAKLIEKVTMFYDPAGAGFKASKDFARIISEQHVLRIKGLIDDAVSKGARILIGGETDVSDRFISPTLLEGVTEGMAMFDQEVFGPVLAIQGFAAREQVIAEIEKRPKPLGLYIFTQTREVADWYLDHTRAGTSAINNIATQASLASLPFGGANHSGIGRLNGWFGFQEFSNLRGVAEDPLDPAQALPTIHPPYPPSLAAYLDQLLSPDTLNDLGAK
jgi:aldehyde dehydrogenase (NAD+)